MHRHSARITVATDTSRSRVLPLSLQEALGTAKEAEAMAEAAATVAEEAVTGTEEEGTSLQQI